MRALPEEALLVGDSPHRDMEPGKRLGIRTVYARYGDRFSTERTALHADFIIDSMNDLLPVVSGLSGRNGEDARRPPAFCR
jgi:putative hydrolase of the HAD superfamily